MSYVGICAAAVVKKTVEVSRLWEYRYFLENIKKYIPVLKKQMTRSEFISLKLFTLKNARDINSSRNWNSMMVLYN